MSDFTGTYDPADGPGNSNTKGRIYDAYQRLKGRGEDERADRLRSMEAIQDQLSFVDDVREFDPVNDGARNSGRLEVKRVYEGLREIADEADDETVAERAAEAADELRYTETVSEQRSLARDLRREFNLDGGGPNNMPRMEPDL